MKSKQMIALSAFLLSAQASCSDDGDAQECGAGDASGAIESLYEGTSLLWSEFSSSANNDCPVEGAPTSLLIQGSQEGSDRLLTFCVPRPDLLGDGVIEISDDERLQLISVFADVDGCLLAYDREVAASGSAEFQGVCDDGQHPGGYAMTLDLTLGFVLICEQETTQVALQISGTTPVVESTP